jgi:glycosyltransferase involved in cell wall biosynthesis
MVSKNRRKKLCVVTPYLPSTTETFIRAHVDLLPATVILVHGWRASISDHTVLSFPHLVVHKLRRTFFGAKLDREQTDSYLKVFRHYKVDAVLAEYGGCGVWSAAACQKAGIPLIVHFHGHDVSDNSILKMFEDTYPQMFQTADALIAVSRVMRDRLISLGAPPEKIHYNPYGVDCEKFFGAHPASSPLLFIAVGRFTAKKAPQNTLAAFAKVLRARPEARLVMIGDGPLLNESQELAEKLAIDKAVSFPGGQPHEVIEREMRSARCFVQHSIVAPSGDSEGTPVAIIEAGATGLPVVATRHAGIPDVVVEGETGFLVDEGDVEGMARYMLQLADDAELAGRMGNNAQNHIQSNFSQQRSLSRLWEIIESCINSRATAESRS